MAGVMRVSRASWSADGERLRAVRAEVFVGEQGVDPGVELDGLDPGCFHAIALDDAGAAIGAARMGRDGRIGRMAVLAGWRGRGVGRGLMGCLLDIAEGEGIARTYLHSQGHAAGFYEQFGFRAEGGEFSEAGIPHVAMVREAASP